MYLQSLRAPRFVFVLLLYRAYLHLMVFSLHASSISKVPAITTDIKCCFRPTSRSFLPLLLLFPSHDSGISNVPVVSICTIICSCPSSLVVLAITHCHHCVNVTERVKWLTDVIGTPRLTIPKRFHHHHHRHHPLHRPHPSPPPGPPQLSRRAKKRAARAKKEEVAKKAAEKKEKEEEKEEEKRAAGAEEEKTESPLVNDPAILSIH